MTGLPTSGKISVRILPSDMIKPARIAINATITARGRVRAARTRRIVSLPWNSLTYGLQEGLDIPTGRFNLQNSAPHAQPGNRLVGLALNHKPFSLYRITD